MKRIISLIIVVALILTISSSAFAVDFAPSIENKGGPEVVTETANVEGEEITYAGTLISGTDVTYVGSGENNPSGLEYVVVITPISEAGETIIANAEAKSEIATDLYRAEAQVMNTDDIADVIPEVKEALEKYKLSSTDPLVKELKVEDLILIDLFDISLLITNTGEKIDFPSNTKFKMILQTNLKLDTVFFVLHNLSGTNWEIVEDVSLDADGKLTCIFTKLSPFAIVVDPLQYGYSEDDDDKKDDSDDSDDSGDSEGGGTVSPITGIYDNTACLIVAEVVICAAVAYPLIRKKSK